MTITSQQLQELHEKLCSEGRAIMAKKNADYKAGSGDPFANFRMSTLLHVPPPIGAMLRIQDKFARLLSFIEKGRLAVSEESWHDCIIDTINYAVILHGLLEELSAAKTVAPCIKCATTPCTAAYCLHYTDANAKACATCTSLSNHVPPIRSKGNTL